MSDLQNKSKKANEKNLKRGSYAKFQVSAFPIWNTEDKNEGKGNNKDKSKDKIEEQSK